MKTEDLEAILDAAEGVPTAPKPADAVSDERVAEIRERLLTEGDVLAIWRASPEVDSLVSDLLAGVEMNPSLFGLAMKAARLGHSAETIVAHLSALIDASAAQGSRPDRVRELRADLGKIVARAVATAGASLNTPYVPATEDLPPVEDDDTPLDPRERMFRDFVWCERLKKIVEIATGAALDQTQFDTRCADVGPCGHRSLSPWAIFRNRHDLRRNIDGLTFRPGRGRLIEEDGVGLCVNTWVRPETVMPPAPDDDAVKVFLDHAAFVIPDAGERKIVLDWMAWVAQHQDEKPNWALVLGSTHEGVGKDLLLNPLRCAIDRLYVREISAGELVSGFNGWMDRCKLVIVQEMENFERRRTANLLVQPGVVAGRLVARGRSTRIGTVTVPRATKRRLVGILVHLGGRTNHNEARRADHPAEAVARIDRAADDRNTRLPDVLGAEGRRIRVLQDGFDCLLGQGLGGVVGCCGLIGGAGFGQVAHLLLDPVPGRYDGSDGEHQRADHGNDDQCSRQGRSTVFGSVTYLWTDIVARAFSPRRQPAVVRRGHANRPQVYKTSTTHWRWSASYARV
jgi:hypothetical protein